ncbi:hypothetical protein Zmor_014869 [Zophobas morio]|uniref:Tyr recombinase domain-containing protein n=1 Tax=Zophobas morio TaxID=2755281 RepID=A0AA38ILL8_9CUCU|nr:hypothetical protein Zmor_014869 [Zophobas morio]
MVTAWNEDTPAGLQKKFYQISAYELAWRGGEAANCLLHYFKIEKNNKGEETGRIECNSVFSKTTQGVAKPLANSKWLIANKDDLNICPVRLFKKLSSKRTTNITTERFFLTPNPQWQNDNSPWYKNCPVGKNEIGKWTKLAAEKIGLDVCNINITNHSNRATAVSHLAKSGLDEQQIIKITGHASTSSLAPYLEIDTEHHEQIIKKMRLQEKESNTVVSATNELQAKASSNKYKKIHSSVWSQFENFCSERNYILQASTTPEEISNILMDYAYNMKKVDGSDYKESCVKTMWNVTAKLVQEKFFNEYQISINPFNDLCFKKARNARDSKRRELQAQADKRKVSSVALTEEELMKIKNFKTAQGGNHRLEDSKWLTTNKADLHMCPVRVLTLLLSKRTPNITCERLFLTVNPYWKKSSSSAWYKNTPIGRNEINKWTRCAAEEIGIDTKKVKITNHSTRSTVVSHLVKAGISEHQLIKITGHKNATSLKPYLKVDQEHHKKLWIICRVALLHKMLL